MPRANSIRRQRRQPPWGLPALAALAGLPALLNVALQLLAWAVCAIQAGPGGEDLRGLPLAMASPRAPVGTMPALRVRLQADPDGNLTRLALNEFDCDGSFEGLRSQLARRLAEAAGRGLILEAAELELDCDYNLRYDYVLRCLDAVSGITDQRGNRLPLIERIRLAPSPTE